MSPRALTPRKSPPIQYRIPRLKRTLLHSMSQPVAKRRKLSAPEPPQPSTSTLMNENFDAITTSLRVLRSHIRRGQSQIKDLQNRLDVLETQLERFVVLEGGQREPMESSRMAGESGFEADSERSSSPGISEMIGTKHDELDDYASTFSDSGSVCCSSSTCSKSKGEHAKASSVSESCSSSSSLGVKGGSSRTSLAGSLPSGSDSDSDSD
ncbi:hypothetical protein BO94DRAFT_530037 [Aspergillus sclerotioniger CBS 115572]|uniref:Uncharacterized protein n=1 Tax=Aspergillus sclerotioniger CBS 115572 TaxID=1450535 RepID=A0A317XDF7_9EURO|nr:hypothetical protein BO94DRAFT_530037 [Aspergillus sclerotioniger CBS 115572]PWY96656.1 hypothetical protein BO94DRAFT_530037 [Aspergillus sclerotioniger CBS 115572]